MKNYLSILAITAISIFSSFSTKDEVYILDLNKSKIEWTGRKVTGSHTGEIKLASGTLNFNKNKLSGGSFEIDMNSITNNDLTGTSATKLLGHLKSDDFFSTDKNPNAQFIITNVTHQTPEKAIITGKLTIKGIANTLSFPATVKQKNNILVATATGVKIDRTKYDIKYRSNNFITGLGDKAIDDNFELNILISAKK
ncbi:YceI family protein [Pedobacter arcticus]|uniref:YceI family protein n=1 Tax=Pedobacter arcticus TaxID=752140 RepID=UPI000303AFB8|nr:YceI family protein [Pedobacter arcticus]